MSRSFHDIIHEQRVLFYGHEYQEYYNIPIIFVKVFERLEDIISTMTATNADLVFKTLFIPDFVGKIEFYEALLISLRKSINEGKWEELKKITDISILIELVYEWLEQHVVFVISPVKICNISENDLFLEFLKVHNEKAEYKATDLRQLANIIKGEISHTEIEILLYFSSVFDNLSAHITDKSHFEKFQERIFIHLLGYEFENVYNNDNHQEVEFVFFLTRALAFIIHIVKETDASEDVSDLYFQSNFGNFLTRAKN